MFLKQLEVLCVTDALNRTHGRVPAAADLMGVTEEVLRAWMKRSKYPPYQGPTTLRLPDQLLALARERLAEERRLAIEQAVRAAADTPEQRLLDRGKTALAVLREVTPELERLADCIAQASVPLSKGGVPDTLRAIARRFYAAAE